MLHGLGAEAFFDELIAKKIHFSDFLEGKGYIFEPYLYNKLGNVNVVELLGGRPFSLAASFEFFCQTFHRPVYVKKAEFFEFFWIKLDNLHCPLRFISSMPSFW